MKHIDPFMSVHILEFPDVALRCKGKTGFWTASAFVTCCSENKVLFPSTHEQTCSFLRVHGSKHNWMLFSEIIFLGKKKSSAIV